MINALETFFGLYQDKKYMKQALIQALKAYSYNEVPIGAVVVNGQGKIIARGYNQVEKKHTQQAHAEMIALAKAAKVIKDWRLTDCWLYSTLEPCHMCMGLIRLSRLAGIIYATRSPLFGYSLDKQFSSRVYKNDQFTIVEGICAQESSEILRQFFNDQRTKKDTYDFKHR